MVEHFDTLLYSRVSAIFLNSRVSAIFAMLIQNML